VLTKSNVTFLWGVIYVADCMRRRQIYTSLL